MKNWRRFAQDWKHAIKVRYPDADFDVSNFGDEIRITLYKGHFSSPSSYFPFGKFYYGLENKMSPEMFSFWRTVENLRCTIPVHEDFTRPDPIPWMKSNSNYSWRYSIGSPSKKYIDLSSLKEEIRKQGLSDQLQKDAEWLEKNRPMEEKANSSSGEKTSSRKFIAKELNRLADELEKRGCNF